MMNTATVTVDGRFARHQMQHGLVVAAAVAEHDLLVVAVPRAGRVDMVRVTWPHIHSVRMVDGTIRVIDADATTTMPDLHSRLLTGSISALRTTRDELIAQIPTTQINKKHAPSKPNDSVATRVPVATLHSGFGLAERWQAGTSGVQDTQVPGLPTCRSINLDAFAPQSTRAVLVLDGPTHGQGHMYLEHAAHGSTSFAVGATSAGGRYFVTGPQRSGTTFLAHAISYDLGIQHIDEVDFQTFDYAQFREVAARSQSWVAQAPALFHHLADLQNDFTSAVAVVCRRSVDDIVASQRRINWGSREEGFERRHLGIPDGDQRPIAEIKYELWDRHKHTYRHFVEVPYADLRQHPLYVETRSDFGAKRWS